MTTLIIDGDHAVYRCAASCEPNKTKLERDPLDAALWRIDACVEDIYKACEPAHVEMYIGGEDNFRKTLYPQYKANRAGKVPPLWLQECREYLVTQYKAKVVNGMEVDDMCGIRMTRLYEDSWVDSLHSGDFSQTPLPICVSLDKDLLQIPGTHYNFVNKEFTTTTLLQGLRIFYKQIILGDLSDNVPGYDGKYRSACPKFIQAIQAPIDEMTEELDMYNHVCEVYQATTEDWESTVNLHAQLLYCLREEGKMWQPPNAR